MAEDKIFELQFGAISERNLYGTGPSIAFAYCSLPIKGKIVKLQSNPVTCRDAHCNTITLTVRKTADRTSSVAKIPLTSTRLIIGHISGYYISDATKMGQLKNFDAGLNIINIMERKHGWPLTKMYRVKCENDSKYNFVMLTGSKRWMRSSHMMSLYCLLFRLGKLTSLHGIKSHAALMRQCKELSERGKVSDGHYIRVTLKYWNPIMGNFDKLFRGISMEKAYSAEALESQSGEGIYKLCAGLSKNVIVREAFQKRIQNL